MIKSPYLLVYDILSTLIIKSREIDLTLGYIDGAVNCEPTVLHKYLSRLSNSYRLSVYSTYLNWLWLSENCIVSFNGIHIHNINIIISSAAHTKAIRPTAIDQTYKLQLYYGQPEKYSDRSYII